MSTKKQSIARFYAAAATLGLLMEEADSLRRIERTLHRWAELECGTDAGHIERDEESFIRCHACGKASVVSKEVAKAGNCPHCGDCAPIQRHIATGKPVFVNARARYVDPHDPRARHSIPDREAGALRRLAKLMARHPELVAYHQGDPRGCALYILRKSDVPDGVSLDAIYSRGWAVCY